MEIIKQNSALLVMDMQTIVVSMMPDAKETIEKIAKAIVMARSKEVPVIYVVIGFRPGGPEINMNNKSFALSKERFASLSIEETTKIDPALAPLPGDIIVKKLRVSAFTGSDLEVILRAQGIKHLILTGFATSGVVLSTIREAADKDYQLTVISDGCADRDQEVHRVLTTKIFPRQADVITVEEWGSK